MWIALSIWFTIATEQCISTQTMYMQLSPPKQTVCPVTKSVSVLRSPESLRSAPKAIVGKLFTWKECGTYIFSSWAATQQLSLQCNNCQIVLTFAMNTKGIQLFCAAGAYGSVGVYSSLTSALFFVSFQMEHLWQSVIEIRFCNL